MRAVRPGDRLRGVEPRLPTAFVDAHAKRVLRALADPLPACAESIGFECSLARDAHVVDLGVSVPFASGYRDALAGRTKPREITRLVEGDARWGWIRAFAARWGETPTLSATRMPFVFLEFDADGPRDP